jgi:hypothetical protein
VTVNGNLWKAHGSWWTRVRSSVVPPAEMLLCAKVWVEDRAECRGRLSILAEASADVDLHLRARHVDECAEQDVNARAHDHSAKTYADKHAGADRRSQSSLRSQLSPVSVSPCNVTEHGVPGQTSTISAGEGEECGCVVVVRARHLVIGRGPAGGAIAI